MKILFKNLPEGEGTVKVSLDGGDTFKDHPINTVRENGIQLADDQDYSKILIKGNANIFRNLDVISKVKVGDTGIPFTYEKPVYELSTVTYKCYILDQDNNGERDGLGTMCVYVKNVNNKDTFYIYTPWDNNDKPFAGDTNELIDAFEFSSGDLYITGFDKQSDNSLVVSASVGTPGRFIPYPTNDLIIEEKTIVDTETVTEVIEFLQDPPTITENGTVTADEGKAFKSVNVEVPKSELGFKCFYNYAPNRYFGDESESTDTQDSDFREYNILMSNNYLEHLCNDYLGFTYNGVVGIYNHEETQDVVNNYYTLDSEYNLFEYHTIVNQKVLHLYFYRSTTSQDSAEIVDVRLIDGSRIEYEPM